MRIDAKGVYYKQLNEQIHKAVKKGTKKFVLDNINNPITLRTIISDIT